GAHARRPWPGSHLRVGARPAVRTGPGGIGRIYAAAARTLVAGRHVFAFGHRGRQAYQVMAAPVACDVAAILSFVKREITMCGIIGVVGRGPVNQLLYDGLLLLQHRGQDAAGIATSHGSHFNMFKAHGLVRDVFRTRNMRSLPGTSGLGHVRYPTAGSSQSEEEAQPFYVNAPFGITFAHNGNRTNWRELRESLYRVDRRHINTNSDSEVLLNVLAHELQLAANGVSLDEDAMFRAVAALHKRVRGAYAVVAQISGYGMLAFRDPHGIRPLCIGRQETDEGVEWMVASESVALEGSGFEFLRDVQPGEAVFVDLDGRMVSRQCADSPQLVPCIFEYVYFARPDSLIDGVSVYGARLRMGEYLADK